MTTSAGKAILVTGATGGIGRQLVSRLTELGEPVRALARRQAQVDGFTAQGVDAVLGDLGDQASLEAAMEGVDRVFLLTAGTRDQRAQGRHAVEAAIAAGVRRVVHLSTIDAKASSAVPWASAPAYTDALLEASGLEWTLLKPAAFMQNLLQSAPVVRRGLLPGTSRRGVLGWIDTGDIAAVAARVLVEDGHEGCAYTLTGPDLLSMPDVAAQLSSVLGRRVRHVHLPGPLFSALLRLSGSDAWLARGLVHQFADVVRHGHDGVDDFTEVVRAITGQPPRSLAEFAATHRDALAGP